MSARGSRVFSFFSLWFRTIVLRPIALGYGRIFHGLEVRGARRVPRTGAAIIVSNHPTYYDPVFLNAGLARPIRYLAWAALFRVPGLAWLVRAFGTMPVDIDRVDALPLEAMKTARRYLAAGEVVGVFPEGGRTHDLESGMDVPKRGAAHLALAAGVPIVPAAVLGGLGAWPRTRRLPLPGRRMRLVYFDPIAPAPRAAAREARHQAEADLTERVARPMRRAIGAWRRAERRRQALRERTRLRRVAGWTGLVLLAAAPIVGLAGLALLEAAGGTASPPPPAAPVAAIAAAVAATAALPLGLGWARPRVKRRFAGLFAVAAAAALAAAVLARGAVQPDQAFAGLVLARLALWVAIRPPLAFFAGLPLDAAALALALAAGSGLC